MRAVKALARLRDAFANRFKDNYRNYVRIKKVFSEGVQLFIFILVNEWIQIQLESGHHRPASETLFKWRFAGVPMIAQH